MNHGVLLSLAFIGVVISAFLQQRLPTPPPKAVGIDLGTTFSCVAIFIPNNSTVTVFSDQRGEKIIPSVVSFRNRGEILIGKRARDELSLFPNNTIFDAKRFIGREIHEVEKDTDLEMYPFKVVNENNQPKFLITVDDKELKYSPEYISSLILTKMKQTAEFQLGRTVAQAVIAVPVEFNDKQRKATEEAAKLAGLEVLRMIHEPTAAAMAYGLHKKSNVSMILVFDFGGGTLDVSILGIEGGIFQVLSTHGDKHLGGEDFNHHLMEHFKKNVKQQFGRDIGHDNQVMQQLRKEVERAKIELSQSEKAEIVLEFSEGQQFKEVLTRKHFEELNQDLFERMMIPVSKALTRAKLMEKDIDEIVLVGGSTRIPKVREALSTRFSKQLNLEIDPDEAVARGTAVQAAILTDSKNIPVAAVEI